MGRHTPGMVCAILLGLQTHYRDANIKPAMCEGLPFNPVGTAQHDLRSHRALKVFETGPTLDESQTEYTSQPVLWGENKGDVFYDDVTGFL